MHRRQPYDLTVYHLGNARCHDYMWGYLFRYPGLVVLHDAQVHQARAQSLLQRWKPRRDDYLAEFAANHPDAPDDLGLLFEAGLGGLLYAHWPLVRLVLQRARLAAVHSAALAARLRATLRRRGGGDTDGRARSAGSAAGALARGHSRAPRRAGRCRGGRRLRRGDAREAPARTAGSGGGADRTTAAPARADRRRPVLALRRRGGCRPRAGWPSACTSPDSWTTPELGAYLAAADLCACMRWPSNGETSASWWRAMAAGRATIITDLVHQPELPVVDPRGWRTLGPPGAAPVAVAIPILDEHRTLVEALDVLARSSATRAEIGDEARRYWKARHTLDLMAEAYVALLPRAAAQPAPAVELPAHLRVEGDEHLTALLAPFGVDTPDGVAKR